MPGQLFVATLVVNDFERLYLDIGPSYTQRLPIAATLQGKTVKDVLSQQKNQGPEARAAGPPGSCFGCGLMAPQIRQCSDR